jgi:signal transduction histidine kinase
MAIGIALFAALFLFAHRLLANTSERHLLALLNNASWAIAALIAALACFFTAQRLPAQERKAWLTLSAGCALWFLGQLVWTYYESFVGTLPVFPHWMQVAFIGYPLLFAGGLMLLPKPSDTARFTPRHGGNLALIVCTLMVVSIIAFSEPAMQPERRVSANFVVLTTTGSIGIMFVTALYMLWSYRWRNTYWPMLLIVAGSGIHFGTSIVYVHQLMTGTYHPSSWSSVSWLLVFGCIACAGHERGWRARHAHTELPEVLLPRERWLEALVPGSLIALMLAVAWSYAEWLTPRVAPWAIAGGLLFTALLGLRELWIQQQEQQLLAALNASNDNMSNANRELSQSEARFRTLSTQLEQRVNERTVALQQAYRELENFSYAVAHDLKSPLRAIDGFGAILEEEYGAQLDDKARGYVHRMRRNVVKMAELIDDLLAYARVERRDFEFRSVPLPAFIAGIVGEHREEIEKQKARVTTEVPALTVRADVDGLRLALRNLLQNALKFSAAARGSEIHIVASKEPDGIQIAVRDNGIGFDMNHAERIFEMFQRLHRADEIPGTGIGLAIVRKALERMDGRVWAHSEPGAGATFFVLLPATEAA